MKRSTRLLLIVGASLLVIGLVGPALTGLSSQNGPAATPTPSTEQGASPPTTDTPQTVATSTPRALERVTLSAGRSIIDEPLEDAAQYWQRRNLTSASGKPYKITNTGGRAHGVGLYVSVSELRPEDCSGAIHTERFKDGDRLAYCHHESGELMLSYYLSPPMMEAAIQKGIGYELGYENPSQFNGIPETVTTVRD
jgi:hypothetical protein